MATVTTITTATIPEPRGEASHPLWCQYPRQSQPQDAYLALDCRGGRAWCDYNGEIGNAVPMSVHHGHVLRWQVNSLMRAADIAWLMDQCRPLLQTIVDGYKSRWNGNNNIGTYTADAQAAIATVEGIGESTHDLDIEPCDAECRPCYGDES